MLPLQFAHLLTKNGFRQGGPLTRRELTATILLIIETIRLEQLIAPLLQATLAPVLCPEHSAGHGLFRRPSCPFYLFQVLPATGSQRGSEVFHAEFGCLVGRSCQPQCEALLTAPPPFRLTFHATDATQPFRMVIVAINPAQPQALSMPLAFLLANLILLAGPDVGVIIIYNRCHLMLHQPLNDGRRTRGTAGMQQDCATVRGLSKYVLLRH